MSAKGKKRKLDNATDNSPLFTTAPQHALPIPVKPALSTDAYDSFDEQLSESGTKPEILSLIPKYSSDYVPKQLLPSFPQPLQSLHDPEIMKLGYLQLLNKCELQETEISSNMAESVERETRQQSNFKLYMWYSY